MSLLDRISARAASLSATKAAPAPAGKAPPWALRAAAVEGQTIPDPEHFDRQARLYTRLSWIQIAISAVAQSAAGVKLSVERRNGEGSTAIVNHPFEALLQKPNPDQSRFEFLEAHYSWWKLSGNCYWWLNRAGPNDPPSEIWIIPSNQILPVPDGKLYKKGYVYNPGDGLQMPLELWEIVHFKRWNPLNRFVGLTPLESLWLDSHADIAAQKWNANFFARDNAKTAGILAYAEMVLDGDWERIKADWSDQAGGAKNKRMVIMRGAGKGGVEWIPTAMSQVDMQFLEQRNFTKEEIFAMYAPGLASSLAINANRANSHNGNAVFTERAIWPAVVMTSEKVTNDFLGTYDANDVCVPEDPRQKDRALELQEQAAYERTHTIEEVRKKYYSDKPLGDGRDQLLVAEVGKGMTQSAPPDQGPGGQIIDVTNSASGASASGAPAPQLPDSGSGGSLALLPGPLDAAALDIAKWQRKALKRLDERGRAWCDFESAAIDVDDAEAITHALMHAPTESAVKAAFSPGDGLTPEERALYDRLMVVFGRVGNQVVRDIQAGNVPDVGVLSEALRAALATAIAEVVNDRLDELAASVGVHFDTTTLGADIAGQYASTYLAKMDATTRAGLEKAVNAFRATPSMTRDDLIAQLRGTFGARRAELVAITALTEASNQATNRYQELLDGAGVKMERVWRTANDERVCPICGPLNGKPEKDWKDRFPQGGPAHFRCRCGTTLRKV